MKKITYALLLTVFLFGCAGKNIYKDDWKTRIDPGVIAAGVGAEAGEAATLCVTGGWVTGKESSR